MNDKTLRGQMGQLARAFMDVKHRLTRTALKVVVMVDVSPLKAGRFARQVNQSGIAFFDQRFEIAIHRRQTDAWRTPLGQFHDLLRQQGACRRLQGIANGRALTGVAFHTP